MAKRKKRKARKGRMPPALRRYWAGKRSKKQRRKSSSGGHVAKRRKRRHHRAVGAKRRGRRSSGGGITGGIQQDMPVVLAGAVYGFVEGKAKADPNFILNKVPKPIDALGYAGNTALALYAVGYFTKNKWAKLAARATAVVASYQLARKGAAFTKGDETLSGEDLEGDDEAMLGDDELAMLGQADQMEIMGDDAMMGTLNPDPGIITQP